MTEDEKLWSLYVANWRACLQGFLNWTPAQVDDFVAIWEPIFKDCPDWFFHERPGWYIASRLIPKHMKEGKDWLGLRQRIEYELGELDRPWPPDEAALLVVKQRLQSILREHGGNLPTPGNADQ